MTQMQQPQPEIQLYLTVPEVQAIIRVLNDLPTHTGVFPLVNKIGTQADASLKRQEALAEPAAAPTE